MTPDALSTERSAEYATNVRVRPVTDADMQAVLDIYAEGIATRNATFETEVPTAEAMRARWLPDVAWGRRAGRRGRRLDRGDADVDA
jgi:L-amino acid N-acyltransferase YncA